MQMPTHTLCKPALCPALWRLSPLLSPLAQLCAPFVLAARVAPVARGKCPRLYSFGEWARARLEPGRSPGRARLIGERLWALVLDRMRPRWTASSSCRLHERCVLDVGRWVDERVAWWVGGKVRVGVRMACRHLFIPIHPPAERFRSKAHSIHAIRTYAFNCEVHIVRSSNSGPRYRLSPLPLSVTYARITVFTRMHGSLRPLDLA